MRGCVDPRLMPTVTKTTSTSTTSTHTTTHLPFDCNVDPSLLSWPERKKAWCCTKKGIGCPSTTLPFDCSLSSIDVSPQRNAWCCHYNGVGCLTTTTHSYDCRNGLADAEAGWSVAKKAYCCQHYSVGPHCKHNAHHHHGHFSRPYDCNAALARAATAWSFSKQAWCCKNEHKGCVTTTLDMADGASYDCKVGQPGFWPPAKKKWCCAREGRGCQDNFKIVGRDDARLGAPASERSVAGHWLRAGRSILPSLALGTLLLSVVALSLRAVRGSWRLWRPARRATGLAAQAAGASARHVRPRRGAPAVLPSPRELCATLESEYMPVEKREEWPAEGVLITT
jgi:hypothetical protein